MTSLAGADDTLRYPLGAVGVGDRRSTVLLHDERHLRAAPPVGGMAGSSVPSQAQRVRRIFAAFTLSRGTASPPSGLAEPATAQPAEPPGRSAWRGLLGHVE